MIKEVLAEAEQKMKKAVELLRREFAGLRAGRATPALLEKVMVEYYGVATPVNQLATITIPEPRLLVVQPWDKSMLGAVEKAILRSDLGVTPTSDGNVLRLVIPQLTEERRVELVKLIRKRAEESRVSIRNVRREAKETLEELDEAGEISEDESRRGQSEVQKLTDKYIEEVNKVVAAREEEIMSV